jgi:hypothetical protein
MFTGGLTVANHTENILSTDDIESGRVMEHLDVQVY